MNIRAVIACAAALACAPLAASLAEPFPSEVAAAAPEADRIVPWYRTNRSALDAVSRWCVRDPGHNRASPDCINASEAQTLAPLSRTSADSPFVEH